MEITSIELLNIKILEPVTLLTDVLTAFLSIAIFLKINNTHKNSLLKKFWMCFFLFFGFSTFLSGIGHGFMEYSGKYFLYFAWILGCIGVFSIEMASIMLIKKRKLEKIFNYFIVIKLLTAIIFVFILGNFLAVTISTAIGLLGIKMGIRISEYKKHKNNFDKLIIIAIIIAIAPALIHTFKISISPWFNHKDISHVILAISIYVFYKGVSLELESKKFIPKPRLLYKNI